MIFLGYHLRVCLLCSFLVAAVKSSGNTKDDCCGSPKERTAWGITDINPAPQTEAFGNSSLFQRDSSHRKLDSADFGRIYQAHKSRWSSRKTASMKTVQTSQTEPLMYKAKAARAQVVHPNSVMTDGYNNAEAETESRQKASTFPFKGFTETFGQFSLSKGSQINQGTPKQDHVHPLQKSFFSFPWLLQSDASQLPQHFDNGGPKILNLPKINQVSNQIETSYMYETEDHPRGAFANLPGFSGVQDSGVVGTTSTGYAQSTFMHLKLRPADQKSSSTDHTSKSTPPVFRFGSSYMQASPLAGATGTTDGRQPTASQFRSRQAWKAKVHGQHSGKVQQSARPRSFPQNSYAPRSTGYATKWGKPGVDSGLVKHIGFASRSLQQHKLGSNDVPRRSNPSVMGKFKPFHTEKPKEEPVQGVFKKRSSVS